jgi:hypothetical protein
MGNCNKIKNTCPDSTFATCVDYENTLGDNTKLNQPCITLDDTTKDLYELVDDLFDKVDLSEVPNDCLSYIGDKDIKKVVQKYEEEICMLKEKVATLESTAICDMSIEPCDLELGSLVDSCGEVPTTLKGLLQTMITQINTNTA